MCGIVAGAYSLTASAAPGDTYTRVFNPANGTFTKKNPSGTYFAEWKSTENNPELTLAKNGGANDMFKDGEAIRLFQGDWTMSVPSNYVITGYRFAFKGYDGSSVNQTRKEAKVTPAGASAITCTMEADSAVVNVADLEAASVSFNVGGVSKVNIAPGDITVTIKELEPQESILSTSIAGGTFIPTTTWYTMVIRGSKQIKYPGDGQVMNLSPFRTPDTDDTALWCFVKDAQGNYTIYNKAAGTSLVLTSPSTISGDGKEAYVKVQGKETSGVETTWKLTTSAQNADGFYFNQPSSDNAVNDHSGVGKLVFWTGGKDLGSTITLDPVQITYMVDAVNGEFSDFGGQTSAAWDGQWNSKKRPVLNLHTSKNNMQAKAGTAFTISPNNGSDVYTIDAPDGYVVKSYSFSFTSTNNATITPIDGGKAVTGTSGRVEATDINTVSTSFRIDQMCDVDSFLVTIFKTAPQPSGTVVFDNATSPVPYRIPALAQTRDGRLIAVADYRYGHADIGSGKVDLVVRTSEDNGKTWTDSVNIAKGDYSTKNDRANVWKYSYGDPSIVADSESDTVLVVCVGGDVGFWSSNWAANKEQIQHCVRIYSYDGGKTWQQPEVFTDQIYKLYDDRTSGTTKGLFLTSGAITQSRYIKVGSHYRLYIAHPLNTGGSAVIYSDDFGKNWKVLGDKNTLPVTSTCDESKAEEMPDGSVVISSRKSGRAFNVYTYTNHVTGEGTWGTEANAAGMSIVNACNGDLMIVPALRKSDNQQVYVALQSVPQSSSRDHVGFYYKEIASYDDYKTGTAMAANWKTGLQVTKNTSCYSTMRLLQNDSIGFLWEENSYNSGYDIMYKAFTLDTITKGEYMLDRSYKEQAKFMDAHVEAVSNTEGITTGTTIGMFSSIGGVEEAKAAYMADKTIANMEAVSQALLNNPRSEITEGAAYKITSTHNYGGSNQTGTRYMSTDGTNLTTTQDGSSDEAIAFQFVPAGTRAAAEASWYLQHVKTGKYAKATGANETKVGVTSNIAEAATFIVKSATNGHSYIACTAPTGPNASLHSARDGRIVPWVASFEGASAWLIDPVDVPTAIEAAAVVVPAKAEVYDLQGRRVAAPGKGVYIVNRKKVVRK